MIANEQRLQQILAQGFPTPRQEAWKYTDMRALAAQPFRPAQMMTEEDKRALSLAAWPISDYRIVLLNGYWSAELSHLPPEMTVTATAASTTDEAGDIFHQLNQTFCPQELHIHIAANAKIALPLQIICFGNEEGWIQPRLHIQIDSHAHVTLYQLFISHTASITNAVTRITVAENAQVHYIQWQAEADTAWHIARSEIQLAEKAQFYSHYYATGSRLARSEIHVTLHGAKASALLYGLYAARHRQHLDQQTCITHSAPYTTSEQHYRGLAYDQARAVFNGKIRVQPSAPHTIARQSNHNLLLSSQAEIDAKPELEIDQNEVQCTHGATIGQLETQALFYLQTRGLPLAEARQLLVQGFMEKIVQSLPVAAIAQALRTCLQKKAIC